MNKENETISKSAKRVKKHREKLKEYGYKSVTIQLDERAYNKLKKACEHEGKTYSEMLNLLIKSKLRTNNAYFKDGKRIEPPNPFKGTLEEFKEYTKNKMQKREIASIEIKNGVWRKLSINENGHLYYLDGDEKISAVHRIKLWDIVYKKACKQHFY